MLPALCYTVFVTCSVLPTPFPCCRYVAWRGLPRDLTIRIRRYYEFFYEKQAVFDEAAILGDLNPQVIPRRVCGGRVA